MSFTMGVSGVTSPVFGILTRNITESKICEVEMKKSFTKTVEELYIRIRL